MKGIASLEKLVVNVEICHSLVSFCILLSGIQNSSKTLPTLQQLKIFILEFKSIYVYLNESMQLFLLVTKYFKDPVVNFN